MQNYGQNDESAPLLRAALASPERDAIRLAVRHYMALKQWTPSYQEPCIIVRLSAEALECFQYIIELDLEQTTAMMNIRTFYDDADQLLYLGLPEAFRARIYYHCYKIHAERSAIWTPRTPPSRAETVRPERQSRTITREESGE